MTATTEPTSTAPVPATRLAIDGVLAVVVASVVNALVRFVAVSPLAVPAEFGPLGWAPVINTTAVGVLGATVVYGILTRVSERPDRAFLGIAAAVLALSFVPLLVPPAFLAGAPASVLGTLAVMHVTTAVVAVGLLTRRRPGGGPTG